MTARCSRTNVPIASSPLGLGETVCDTVLAVLLQDPNVKLFNESYLNL